MGGGQCSLKDYGYTGRDGQCKKCTPVRGSQVKSVKGVGSSDSSMMSAINKVPVSIAVYANTAWKQYNSGVFKDSCNGASNHGVLAVGYGTSGSDQFYKIKNSWGSGWGESGYIRLVKGVDGS